MSNIDTLAFISQQINIYIGYFILITGVIGGILNIIIFTSLKTFRETTCAFYLTINSIINVGQLSLLQPIRILSDGFLTDPKNISWVCKLNFSWGHWCFLMTSSSICFATIDQFLSVSKYRYMSNLRIAYRCIITTSILWCAHSFLFVIYMNTPSGTCVITNSIFSRYVSRFYYPFILGFLPTGIMVVFSLLAFYNVRMLNRQVNIIRLSRDRQLTAMVLVYVIYTVITKLPNIIFYIYLLDFHTTDRGVAIRVNFGYSITVLMIYGSYASSFYIYCCVSKRFRKQLVHVLIDVWFKRLQQWMNKLNNNRVVPITKPTTEDYHMETILEPVEIESNHKTTK